MVVPAQVSRQAPPLPALRTLVLPHHPTMPFHLGGRSERAFELREQLVNCLRVCRAVCWISRWEGETLARSFFERR